MFERLGNWLGKGRPDESELNAKQPSLNDAFRMHSASEIDGCTELAVAAFPQFENRIRCFGSDWLGRQFATDQGRLMNGEPQILLLEPGSGEAYEIPGTLDSFLGKEILEHPNETVELKMLREWQQSGGSLPTPNQCVTYKKPLFLGGQHELDNLKIGDMEVWWTICGKLLEQVRSLPEGTPINSVTIR